ncbi:MAG: hypothetical protein HQK96_09595 [Nitrospirae bacterium]|nr:hypothetical protein [Nitrospirota bacterium]
MKHLTRMLDAILVLMAMLIIMVSVPAYAEEEADMPQVPQAMEEAAPIPLEGTAGPDNVTATAVLSLFNKYVSRGYVYSSHSMVIQPAVTFAYMGFAANFWGNIDTRETETQSSVPERPGRVAFNEVDIKLSYTRSWGVFSLTGGYIYYATQYSKQTQEAYIAGALDIITKPVLTVYRDFDGFPGTYFNLAFSHSIPVPVVKDMTVDLGASVGYMAGSSDYWRTYETSSCPSDATDCATGDYTGKKYSAFHDGMLMVGLTIPVVQGMTIQPVAMFTFPLSRDAKRQVDDVSYNPSGWVGQNFTYGFNLTYNF